MFALKTEYMALRYHDPAAVKGPRQFIKAIDVLYDGGADGFSLAMIDWEGTDHIGIRWNVAAKELNDTEKQAGRVACDGAPAANGKPSWFILPRELFNPTLFDKDSEHFMNLVAAWSKRSAQEQ